MKNFIGYYYGLNIHNIYFSNGKYFFYSDRNHFMFEPCKNENFSFYWSELEQQLLRYQYFFVPIINRESSYVSVIENKPYILLKVGNIDNDKICIFDIKLDMFIRTENKTFGLSRFNWIKLWETKIDYFEEWLFLKKDSYKKISTLFFYFIGVSENALLYLKNTLLEEKKEESDELVVSHDRLGINYELYDYYDPTNVILDHASRDISEYIKSMFLNRVWDLEVLKSYMEKNYFSRYGLRLLLSRIVFPSFFFDSMEEMILKNDDSYLLSLESRIDEFQNFIKDVNLFFMSSYDIPGINWLIKKS